ncbi:MAG: hypothetical protein K0S67_1572 [Nitrososphaeraceae archaeon]|nr:hypothetical protein [Nitrososphaeraceae archaeon]
MIISMAIKVDMSYLSSNIRKIILNTIENKSISQKQSNNNNNDIIILDSETDIQKIKEILQYALTKNRPNDYIVTENMEEENEIAILKNGDIEQIGIYICSHCGMLKAMFNELYISEYIISSKKRFVPIYIIEFFCVSKIKYSTRDCISSRYEFDISDGDIFFLLSIYRN